MKHSHFQWDRYHVGEMDEKERKEFLTQHDNVHDRNTETMRQEMIEALHLHPGFESLYQQGQAALCDEPVRQTHSEHCSRSNVWSLWSLWGGRFALVGCMCLMLFIWLPGAPQQMMTAKSSNVRFGMLYTHRGTGVAREAVDGQLLHPGDFVQFYGKIGRKAYVAVVGVDAKGRASFYVPAHRNKKGVPLPVGGGQLPDKTVSLELDHSLGRERIFFVYSIQPFIGKEAEKVLLKERSKEKVSGRWRWTSMSIQKVHRLSKGE